MNSVQPVLKQERIETLDIIRGFALFGIFIVNMLFFHSPKMFLSVTGESLWESTATNVTSQIIILFLYRSLSLSIFSFFVRFRFFYFYRSIATEKPICIALLFTQTSIFIAFRSVSWGCFMEWRHFTAVRVCWIFFSCYFAI
ncbi:MAG: hypothetical protein LRY71_07025 [Bacillaceae bacterium]|nr:hypothetical protein [Bacillaceae bacterium]